MSTRTRTEWLEEARLLEAMGAEWEIGHAAAFCLLSVSSLYRSDCPRIEKEGLRGTKDKPMIRFNPSAVRQWNERRTRKVA